MTDRDPRVAELLDRVVPATTDGHGDWETVLREATAVPRKLSRRRLMLAAPAFMVGAAVAAALFRPFGSRGAGIADRALAAIGPSRVVHIVVRVRPPGTAIDLRTGRRAPVTATIEQWYEPGVGLRQRVIRSNGALPPGNLPFVPNPPAPYASVLSGFATGYRDALRSGGAHVLRQGRVGGHHVYWLRFASGPVRVGGGSDYDVAVDAVTYRPRYVRQTIDGRPVRGSGSKILSIEGVAAVPASVATLPATNESIPTMFGIERTGRLALDKAVNWLPRQPFWLGDRHRSLPLVWLGGLEYSEGHARKWSEIKHHWHGLELVYGAVDNFGFAIQTKPYLRLEEQPAGESLSQIGGDALEGTLVLYETSGVVEKGGLHVYIDASSADLVVSAAKALTPIPP